MFTLCKRFLPFMVLTVLLGACGTPMVWTRPGVTAENIQSDLRECSQLAFRESWMNYGWRGAFYDPWPFYSRRHGRHFYRPAPWEFDSGIRERHLQDFCMRARGYHLERVAPEG